MSGLLTSVQPPPVLTPRVLTELEGVVPPRAIRKLLDLMGRAIEQCFLPLSRANPDSFPSTLTEAVRGYAPIRMEMISTLLKATKAPERLLDEMSHALDGLGEEWLKGSSQVGLARRDIRNLLRMLTSHLRTSHRVLSDRGVKVALESIVATPAYHPYVLMLSADATEADLEVSAILLGVEGEIQLGPHTATLLLLGARSALPRVDSRLELLMGGPEHRKAALGAAIAKWVLRPDTDASSKRASYEAAPLDTGGISLSEVIVRERR